MWGKRLQAYITPDMSEDISNPDEIKKDSYFPNEIEA